MKIRQQTANHLEARLAELDGDIPKCATLLCGLGSAVHTYEGDVLLGKHAEAAHALESWPKVTPEAHLLLSIVAREAGDHAAADRYFTRGILALSKWGPSAARLAQVLETGETPTTDQVEDCVDGLASAPRLVALGCRFPKIRGHCFAKARLFLHRGGGIRAILDTAMKNAERRANVPVPDLRGG